MNWKTASVRPKGFRDAGVVLVCEAHLLARWNHDRCRAWQLYEFRHPQQQSKTNWLIGAGRDSLEWNEDAVILLAERFQCVRKVGSRL
jgi:hypothetical protein